MKFLGKTCQLLLGGTIGVAIAFSNSLTDILPPGIEIATAQQPQTLSPEEINLRAKQIIVRIDGASVGSGSLIESNDSSYTVLTNWHVVKNQGEYTVSTIDGRKHQVDPASIKQLPGLDLAIIKFTSNQNYQVAELGNSSSLNEGQSVYFAGYPGELRKEDNRYYRFFSANLVGILPKPTENGYALIYNGEAFPGMSGGPVFNREGLVIGVHGEANVHALSGGTSNYGIPINTYQTAIANLNKPVTPESTPSENASQPESSPTEEKTATQPPTPPEPSPTEEKTATQPPPPPESSPTEEKAATQPPAPPESSPTEEKTPPQPSDVSSVPTFEPDSPADKPQPQTQQLSEETKKPDTEKKPARQPELTPESTVASEEETTPKSDPEPKTSSQPHEEEVELETVEVSTITTTRQIALVSPKTGINYTPLRDLLKAEKWSEADLQTYKIIEQLVQTAKQKNRHVFIELKTIAEFSCPDIRTIDALWKKYTGDKFGFSSQQKVWQSVNQQGDFSTQTWRRFATEVGWKKGEVDSGSGYLLYEQLNFDDPAQAPVGHLPWWFSLPDEEQKVIKHLFARCNFNPSPQELAAEEGKNNPQKPRENNNNNNADSQDKKPASNQQS